MSLLDLVNNAGSGLLNVAQAIPQAAQGQFAQPPAIDPALAQMLSPGQLAAMQSNYQRNMASWMQLAAMKGASLGGMGAMAGQGAGAQYNNDVMQSVRDAMLIRQMSMMNGGGQDEDPFTMMKRGAALAQMGLPGAQQVMDAAKAQIDPGVVALHNARSANKAGDSDAATSYYIQYLKATGRLNISDRNGALTLLGGTTPEDLRYVSVNPADGTITGPSSQSAMRGAPAAKGAIAAGKAAGEKSADIVQVDMGDGTTQQVPYNVARRILGGGAVGLGGGQAPAARPAVAPAPAAAPAAAPQPAAAVPQIPPQLAQPLSDSSFRAELPQAPVGRTLNDAQKTQQQKFVSNAFELKQEGEQTTQGAATTLTYIKAAQAILNSGGHIPTGLTAPMQSAISRGMAALDMGPGDWAAKSQELVKYLGNLALSNAKATYGPRITQNEVRLQLEELSPSQSMQPQAIADMLDKLGRISQYAIDSADRSRYYLSAHNEPLDFAKWNQKYFPMAEATTPAAGGFQLPQGWSVKQH